MEIIEEEIWKDIKGYEGLYQVSNLGRVKSLERYRKNGKNKGYIKPETILKPLIDSSDYLFVILQIDCLKKHLRINRQVALHFIPNPLNLPEVNHLFGDKSDNRACVLEWSTHSENMKHAFRTGLRIGLKGEKNPKCKLTKKIVNEIRDKFKTGNYTKLKLSKEYNISDAQIGNIVRFKMWNH